MYSPNWEDKNINNTQHSYFLVIKMIFRRKMSRELERRLGNSGEDELLRVAIKSKPDMDQKIADYLYISGIVGGSYAQDYKKNAGTFYFGLTREQILDLDKQSCVDGIVEEEPIQSPFSHQQPQQN